MKTVDMTPKMMDLSELLEAIASGEIVLPAFQRDFDWTESDVRELLVTVVCGWPAGNLLLMQGSGELFRTRPFEFAPTGIRPPRFSVLDGQQRLTALYHALYDLGSHVFAIDWANLSDEDLASVDEAVLLFRRQLWDERFRQPSEQRHSGLLPFYALKSPSDFYDWRDAVVASAPESEQEMLKQQLTSVYTSVIGQMHRYRFPVVILESELQPAAIARVFERVNRTGIRLTVFDLMVAQTYEPDWNLRDRWDSARRESDLLDRFLGDDGLPVLQVISLKYRSDVRQGAVLEVPRTLVWEQWDSSVAATEAALEFLVRECGVADPAWLPYRAMVLLLGGLAFERELRSEAPTLRSWFFSRAFSLFYDVASNTRVASDLREVRRALDGSGTVSMSRASETVLFEATRRGQTAIWRAFLCALAYNGAVDLTGTGFSYERGSTGPSDAVVQPIFSRGIEVGEKEPPVHLRALNLMLATRETARQLRREGLKALVEAQTGSPELEFALSSQFLPPSQDILRLGGDWRGLLSARLDLLAKFLAREMGQLMERGEVPPSRAV